MGYDYILTFKKKQHIKKSIYLQFFLGLLIVLQQGLYWADSYGIKEFKVPRKKLATGVQILDGLKLPRSFQLPSVPKPELWEYVWLLRLVLSVACTFEFKEFNFIQIMLSSLLVSVVGLRSLKKDSHKPEIWPMRVYYYGSILIGLGTCVYTLATNATSFMDFVETRTTDSFYYGLPIVLLRSFYLVLLTEVHLYGIWNCHVLLGIWTKKVVQKTKSS